MKREAFSTITVLFLSILLAWVSVSADVLHLKDGTEVEGTVTETTETTLTIVTSTGAREYPISAIDYVDKEEAEAQPEPNQPASEEDLAYRLLEELAQKKKGQRALSATGWIIGGIGVGVLVGAYLFWVSPPLAWLGLVPAGVGIGMGVLTLATPSEAEAEFAKVSALPSNKREDASAILLGQLAEKGYWRRMTNAAVNALLASVSLLFPSSDDSPFGRMSSFITSAGAAVYNLFVPSAEERTFQMYEGLASAETTPS